MFSIPNKYTNDFNFIFNKINKCICEMLNCEMSFHQAEQRGST